ncbi:MAG TPA: hypothetical protein VFL51_04655 [Pseudolabrys sp.]|nr:hypothetical protein [Pseudolabrys sp.]
MKNRIERLLRSRTRNPVAVILPAAWRQPVSEIMLWGVVLVTVLVAIDFIRLASASYGESELRNAEKIAFESSTRCERRGLRAGTHEHLLCMMDLELSSAGEPAPDQTMELP